MKPIALLLSVALTAMCAAPATAQDRLPDVPVDFRPPPGMCRIWIEAVPPAQQPAPTDCATAVKNRPAHARVLFGDDYVRGKSALKAPLIKSFTGSAPPDKPRRPIIPLPDGPD